MSEWLVWVPVLCFLAATVWLLIVGTVAAVQNHKAARAVTMGKRYRPRPIVFPRRDTEEAWVRVNPVLRDKEPGLNLNDGRLKIGDGKTRWTDLPVYEGTGEVSGGISND